MLLIRAVSFKGRPIGRELAARFGEAGGTIGRGENSTLVLPDPERFISRTQATVSFQAGGFIITDSGTKNPVVLNGRPLGSGAQARLGDGDQIKLGDYLLEVTLAPRSVQPQTPPAGVEVARTGGPLKDDPLAAFGRGGATASDPFADLLKPAPPGAPRPEPVVRPRAEPAIPPVAGPLPPDPLADLRGREASIDELFGLKSSKGPELIGPEPLDRPVSPAGGGPVVDPLAMLGEPAKPMIPPAVPDHGPELFTPYAPPTARPDPVFQPRSEPVTPTTQPSPPPPSPPSTPWPQPVSPTPRPQTPRASGGPAGPEDALVRAFLVGAGVPEVHLPKGLTPETMEDLGKLLREAVQGTLDLLRARGLTKSEMRADLTIIMPVDNNPLKFSPSVDAALGHILAPQVRGFMPPLRAMKDAYDDLRAHQLGFLAGMRAALEEVLARFAPDELEKRLAESSVIDSVLPMNRKAKLWDLFVERYAKVAEEAREDFNAAFGKAFRRAYEAQIKELRGEGRRPGA